jgi:Phage tail assembly chaperone protein, TAC
VSVLPWRDLLHGASLCGLTPTQFWDLSVFEWRALSGETKALDATRLGELCREFPDGDVREMQPT